MKNYHCPKCRTVIVSNDAPGFQDCAGGGFHKWTYLGHAGESAFSCAKCSVMVQSKLMPNALNCAEGDFHEWKKI